MTLDRVAGQEELLGDLGVRHPLGDQLHDRPLAAGEGVQPTLGRWRCSRWPRRSPKVRIRAVATTVWVAVPTTETSSELAFTT
jgi:hypothetical protein